MQIIFTNRKNTDELHHPIKNRKRLPCRSDIIPASCHFIMHWQLTKANTSIQLTKQKFEWQDEYFVVSLSESMIDRVRNYIKHQEEHHSKKTFSEEYEQFISKYGFEKYQ